MTQSALNTNPPTNPLIRYRLDSTLNTVATTAFAAGFLAFVVIGGLTGCNYTAGITEDSAATEGTSQSSSNRYTASSLYSNEYRSVAVPIFQNKTLYTGVERDITDALIKEIQSRTPYAVRSSVNADTILTGTIVSVEKTRLSQLKGSGLVEDNIISITIDFEWKDARSGEIIVQRRHFEAGDVYIPAQPVAERPQIGLWAVSQELATDIVSTMREAW